MQLLLTQHPEPPISLEDFKAELIDGTEIPMDSQLNPTATVIAYDQTASFKFEGLPEGAELDNDAIYWAVQQTEGWCDYNAPRESDATYHTPVFEVSLKDEYQEYSGTHVMIIIAMYAPNGIAAPDTITHTFGFQFYKSE